MVTMLVNSNEKFMIPDGIKFLENNPKRPQNLFESISATENNLLSLAIIKQSPEDMTVVRTIASEAFTHKCIPVIRNEW